MQFLRHPVKCPDCTTAFDVQFMAPPTLTDSMYASVIMIEHPLIYKCPACQCQVHVAIETVNFILRAEKIVPEPEPSRIIVPQGRPV